MSEKCSFCDKVGMTLLANDIQRIKYDNYNDHDEANNNHDEANNDHEANKKKLKDDKNAPSSSAKAGLYQVRIKLFIT